MNKLLVLLVTLIMALSFTACGGSDSDNDNTKTNDVETNTITGSGTDVDPYIIGAGEYEVTTGDYYQFSVNEDNCKVIVYPMSNIRLTITDETLQVLYDDSASNVFTSQNKLLILNQGDYKISTYKTGNKYSPDIGTFGISSTCTDISTFDISTISQGITRLSYTTDGFYKVIMENDGTVLVRGVTGMFEFFDENLNSLGYTYDDEYIISLQKGVNYLFVWTGIDDFPNVYVERQ